jgi:hypothetical protein
MKIKKNIALSDSGFIFNPSSGDSYSINPIGNKILQFMKDDKTEEEIIQLITEEYMIDKDTVEKDLYDFKNMLKSYKLMD